MRVGGSYPSNLVPVLRGCAGHEAEKLFPGDVPVWLYRIDAGRARFGEGGHGYLHADRRSGRPHEPKPNGANFGLRIHRPTISKLDLGAVYEPWRLQCGG